MPRKLWGQWRELEFDKKLGILIPTSIALLTGVVVPVLLVSGSSQSDPPAAPPHGSKAFIPCLNAVGTGYDPVNRPSICTIRSPRNRGVPGVNLIGIGWRTWGKSTAQGAAIERGFGPRLLNVPVELSASHPVRSCGRRMYSLLQVVSTIGGSVTIKLPTCGGQPSIQMNP